MCRIKNICKNVRGKTSRIINFTRLRKHIATVTQLLSLKENKIEQLAKFMGHTTGTHQTFYKLVTIKIIITNHIIMNTHFLIILRLREDIYQVAKVSKILQLLEKGEVVNF